MQHTSICLGIPTHIGVSTGEFDDAVLESRQLPPCGRQNPEDFCMNFPCANPGYGSCPYPDQNCCRKGPQVNFKSINIDIYFSFKDPLLFTESLAVMLNRLLAEDLIRRLTRKAFDDETNF